MRLSLRRELALLRAHAVISLAIVALLATAAFRQTGPQKFDEITVGRINVVDADGTLRLVISNKDRMHPGIIDGKLIDRQRPVAGLIFFNDQGDEVGGLTFSGRAAGGTRRADAGIMFDQLKQDQTIGFSYSEDDGRRTAALRVWDRPETSLGELVEKLNAANRIADRQEREAAIQAVRAGAPRPAVRLFAGKDTNKASVVALADAAGKPRLTLTVDATGNPRIEFLDEQGKVVSRLPAAR